MMPRARPKRAIELFAPLRLPDPEKFGERYPHQVSGGQLQRAMTAMAMVLPARPDHLRRADHGAGRDDADRGAGGHPRRGPHLEGTAAIYITHDLAVVAQVADRIKVLRHGRGRGTSNCWK
jgi:peptide/nickel transport system ATP-binding protein